MEQIKKDLIIGLLIEHELKPAEVYSIVNDIEEVIDSKYQKFADAICGFEAWTDNFLFDQMYEIKQTKHIFKARPHHEKQKYTSW